MRRLSIHGNIYEMVWAFDLLLSQNLGPNDSEDQLNCFRLVLVLDSSKKNTLPKPKGRLKWLGSISSLG